MIDHFVASMSSEGGHRRCSMPDAVPAGSSRRPWMRGARHRSAGRMIAVGDPDRA